MEQDEGASSIRHVLEPPGQALSLLGGIGGTEAEPPARTPGRDSRGAGRLGACLAVSLALHAAVLALVPVPGSGERVAATSTVRVSLSLGYPPAGQDQAATSPRISGAAPEKSALPEAAAPRQAHPGARDAPAPDPEPDLPGTPAPTESPLPIESGAVPGIPSRTPPSGAAGSGGTDFRSASDQAAALLLAKVEAALVYPEAARRRGTEGVVGLQIILDGSGALSDVKIARSSGSALLDRAAREAVAVSLPVPNPSGAPLSFELAVRFTLKKAAAP